MTSSHFLVDIFYNSLISRRETYQTNRNLNDWIALPTRIFQQSLQVHFRLLKNAPANLISLNRFEKCSEVTFTEALVATALNEFKEERP